MLGSDAFTDCKKDHSNDLMAHVDKETWKQLRSGLRIKNIIASKRMQDQKCKASNFEQKKLVITRFLGYR